MTLIDGKKFAGTKPGIYIMSCIDEINSEVFTGGGVHADP